MLYPLRFREHLRNYRFGNRWIARAFAKQGLPEDHRIAETWEVCDRPGESSVVINGPLRGKTLHELIEEYGQELLGRDIVATSGLRFPLLIKFLDASNPLGEQVHPDDKLAEKLARGDPGKTEAWYMLRVKDGPTIHCGNKGGVTREDLQTALMAGAIRDCMVEQSVQPGDAFLLYAGTMHYSAGGVLFYEIMQNSDITRGLRGLRRGRTPVSEQGKEKWAREALRAIHLEDGFDCRTRAVAIVEGQSKRTFVLACQYFALERLDLVTACQLRCDGRRFYVLSQIEGQSNVIHRGHAERLLPGHTCMLPACLDSVTIEPVTGSALLKAYVPDLLRDVVHTLRRAGVGDDDIAALGGKTRLNPLPQLLCSDQSARGLCSA
jgi:mannose-6-phosphate isomerase